MAIRIAFGVLSFAAVAHCLAQGLTEREAVERALGRPAVAALGAGTVSSAEGDLLQARALANPVVGAEQEQVRDERQRTYSIGQRFELGGKRGLRTDAARARLEAVQSDFQARQRVIADETRRRFHEALALQNSLVSLADWQTRLEGAEAVAIKLQRGGEVAGYDRRRVARERITAASRARVASAHLARALDVLGALTGSEVRTLSGSVLPDAPAPLEAYLASLASRSDLKALAARSEAFRYEETLGERTRIPDVTVSAGVRQVAHIRCVGAAAYLRARSGRKRARCRTGPRHGRRTRARPGEGAR
jgi:outer membrane protein, heavy metal efflux system